jgi:hypothetical protein
MHGPIQQHGGRSGAAAAAAAFAAVCHHPPNQRSAFPSAPAFSCPPRSPDVPVCQPACRPSCASPGSTHLFERAVLLGLPPHRVAGARVVYPRPLRLNIS